MARELPTVDHAERVVPIRKRKMEEEKKKKKGVDDSGGPSRKREVDMALHLIHLSCKSKVSMAGSSSSAVVAVPKRLELDEAINAQTSLRMRSSGGTSTAGNVGKIGMVGRRKRFGSLRRIYEVTDPSPPLSENEYAWY
ncbi:hypothetical protein SAY87_017823 [Trapa incisa]|uniref:Uncharacterized protein n=1 Tax=Trapa incisa TaxID=236973 RepID=A0AAN7LAM5_9MYRT|nr:hypothetical protein SAY87_017823 [Trapa incisa]